MRLAYAVEDLKQQRWFDPFKDICRHQLHLPSVAAFRAAWEELDALAGSSDRECFVVPESRWRVDELKETLEEGWLGSDKKGRQLFVYGDALKKQIASRPDLELRYQRLLKVAQEVNESALNIAREFAAVVDKHTSGRFELFEALKLEKGGTAVTRFMQYLQNPEPRNPPHRDRSFLTSHFWESSPGLAFYDECRRRFHASDDARVVCFPGRKLWAATEGLFPQLIHGVCDMRPLAMQAHNPRRVVVSFVHAALSAQALQYVRTHPEESKTYPW